jgi:hypothetical protein
MARHIKDINKTTSIKSITDTAIFKEPYTILSYDRRVRCGTVYYFNNDLIIIRFNEKYKPNNVKQLSVKSNVGIKVIVNYNLIFYTTRLTYEQVRILKSIIEFKDKGINI